jgi:hypothetical protein
MKNKYISIILVLVGMSAHMAYAEPANKPASQQAEKEDGFAKHKSQWAKDLSDEKSGVDQVLNCVNSAKAEEELKKCRNIQKENREKAHERRVSARKEHLQSELKKLDSEAEPQKKK